MTPDVSDRSARVQEELDAATRRLVERLHALLAAVPEDDPAYTRQGFFYRL